MVQNDPECSNFFRLLPKKIRCTKFFLKEFWSNFVRSLGPFQRFFHLLASIDFQIPPIEWDDDCLSRQICGGGRPISVKQTSKYCPFFGFQGFLGQPQPPTEKPPTIHWVRMCSWNSNERGGLLLLDFRSCDHWPRGGYNLEAFTNFGLPRSSNQKIPRSSVSPLTGIFWGFLSFFVQRYPVTSGLFKMTGKFCDVLKPQIHTQGHKRHSSRKKSGKMKNFLEESVIFHGGLI